MQPQHSDPEHDHPSPTAGPEPAGESAPNSEPNSEPESEPESGSELESGADVEVEPADHDQQFKTVIASGLRELVELVKPDWAARLDFSQIEWLQQEQFHDPPHGRRRIADLVAKVGLRDPLADFPTTAAVVVHVEVEGQDSVAKLPPRMHEYFGFLFHKLQLLVLPLALYLKVGHGGLGWGTFSVAAWGDELLTFRYYYAGLPALDAETHVAGSNALAVALSALMRISPQRRGWLKAQAFKRLAELEKDDRRRDQLAELVDNYLELDAEQTLQFESFIGTPDFKEAKNMTTTWHKQGKIEGKIEGKVEQAQHLLLMLGEREFGPADEATQTRISEIQSLPWLETLVLSIRHAANWADLLLRTPTESEPEMPSAPTGNPE